MAAEGSAARSPRRHVECLSTLPSFMAMLPSSVEFVIFGACTLPGLPRQVNSCHHDNKEKEKERLTRWNTPYRDHRTLSLALILLSQEGEPPLAMAIRE